MSKLYVLSISLPEGYAAAALVDHGRLYSYKGVAKQIRNTKQVFFFSRVTKQLGFYLNIFFVSCHHLWSFHGRRAHPYIDSFRAAIFKHASACVAIK